MNKNRRQSDRSLTPAECAKVLAGADGEIRGLILVAMSTGQRIRDIIAIKRGDLDLLKDIIHFNIAKTGVALEMPMDPRVRVWIEQQAKSTIAAEPNAPLFPQLADRGAFMSVAFLRKLGEKVGMVVSGLSFRRTFFHELTEKGTPTSVVQELMGYRSRK